MWKDGYIHYIHYIQWKDESTPHATVYQYPINICELSWDVKMENGIFGKTQKNRDTKRAHSFCHRCKKSLSQYTIQRVNCVLVYFWKIGWNNCVPIFVVPSNESARRKSGHLDLDPFHYNIIKYQGCDHLEGYTTTKIPPYINNTLMYEIYRHTKYACGNEYPLKDKNEIFVA